MNRMLKYSMLVVLFLCMNISNAWALQYEIAYEKTFLESELFYLSHGEELFGVTESTASPLARVSFYLDTEAAPIYSYGAGSFPSSTYPHLALLHDLYGYDISAISNFTATFGNKTWGLDDVYIQNFTIGHAALWMDSPLIDGGTSNLSIGIDDEEGSLHLDSLAIKTGGLGMVQDGRIIINAYSDDIPEMFGSGGVVSIHAVNPIPEPASMLLLGYGLVGLAGFRRKFKKR